ncbi:exported hypothetical protein [uncultured Desulfovibrio sp.]|uniref:Secreted protein n=1 Tax=uncultured Desulfovibrio sp. TaxID=167968 RepID=A0A212L7K6_9BACT|nr:exported hypothetical protein [uncultured Desulfovibrio sp.]VZH34251.1 conserved exported protein of unknown function [Desulfovibrio sp. 86]
MRLQYGRTCALQSFLLSALAAPVMTAPMACRRRVVCAQGKVKQRQSAASAIAPRHPAEGTEDDGNRMSRHAGARRAGNTPQAAVREDLR